MKNKTDDAESLWDSFQREVEKLVADDARLTVASRRQEVIEIVLGRNRLLASHERNKIKTSMHFHGPDHDRPNEIRVTLHVDDLVAPYHIGGSALTAGAAARQILSTFVEKALTR
jgi:hypothetical protein